MDMIRTAAHLCPLFSLGLFFGVAACTAPVASAPPLLAMAPAPPLPIPVKVVPAVEIVDAAPETVGVASWYRTSRRLHRTSSGAILNNNALTAASPTLPMGTLVRVALLNGDASVVLTVNDRMPRGHRILDVTEVAARDLGLMGSGVAMVSVTPVMVADSQ